MRGYHFFGIFAGLLFCVLEISSLAGGFERHYQHSKVAGLGGCGTGFRMGASSAFYNPGAMSFLPSSTASLGAVFYTKNASYLSPYGGNTDQEKSFQAPLHAYGVLKLNDEKSAIGISVNQPFGFSTVWPANWTGKYLVTESTFDTWFIQPTYSYKFGESFSAGLGAVIALGNRYLSRNVNAAAISGSEGVQEFDGSGTGFGVNAGVYYEVEDEFALGLTYRSAVSMSVNSGSVSYSGIPSSLESFYSPASWSGDLKTPSVISLGASYMPNRELLLTAEVNYSGWSAADDVNFSIDDDPANAYNSLWVMDNTITFRAGGEYKLSDKIRVRAGAALDPSPVPDDKVTPEFPDADRFTGSLGVTVNFSETFSADLVFLTENTREREVENADLNFGGTYKTIYNHFGFTVNLDF